MFNFTEGEYTSRLGIIGDIPKGKVIWQFDFTDMALAKEALGDIACMAGNIPISRLNVGTPDKVKGKGVLKKLIDVAGRVG